MSWNWYLVVAYCGFFVLLFAYTLRMAARQRRLDRRIEELQSKLEKDPDRERGSAPRD